MAQRGIWVGRNGKGEIEDEEVERRGDRSYKEVGKDGESFEAEKEGDGAARVFPPHVESLIYIQSALCELLIGL